MKKTIQMEELLEMVKNKKEIDYKNIRLIYKSKRHDTDFFIYKKRVLNLINKIKNDINILNNDFNIKINTKKQQLEYLKNPEEFIKKHYLEMMAKKDHDFKNLEVFLKIYNIQTPNIKNYENFETLSQYIDLKNLSFNERQLELNYDLYFETENKKTIYDIISYLRFYLLAKEYEFGFINHYQLVAKPDEVFDYMLPVVFKNMKKGMTALY